MLGVVASEQAQGQEQEQEQAQEQEQEQGRNVFGFGILPPPRTAPLPPEDFLPGPPFLIMLYQYKVSTYIAVLIG